MLALEDDPVRATPVRGSTRLLETWREAGEPVELHVQLDADRADPLLWRQSLREHAGKPSRPQIQIDGAPWAELMLVSGGSRV